MRRRARGAFGHGSYPQGFVLGPLPRNVTRRVSPSVAQHGRPTYRGHTQSSLLRPFLAYNRSPGCCHCGPAGGSYRREEDHAFHTMFRCLIPRDVLVRRTGRFAPGDLVDRTLWSQVSTRLPVSRSRPRRRWPSNRYKPLPGWLRHADATLGGGWSLPSGRKATGFILYYFLVLFEGRRRKWDGT